MPAGLLTHEDRAAEIGAALASLLAPYRCSVAVLCSAGDVNSLPLPERSLTGSMSARRRGEFAAGRRCARNALADAGCAATFVAADSDGAPVWPKGVIGSISHAGAMSVAVVSCDPRLSAIGIDIEDIERPFRGGVPDLTFEPEELALVSENRNRNEARYCLFSAKEATFKAVHHALRLNLSWNDFRIELASGGARFRPIMFKPRFSECVLEGRTAIIAQTIIAVCFATVGKL